MYRVTGAFSSYIIQYFKELFLSFDTAKLGTKKQRRKYFSVAAQFVRVLCRVLPDFGSFRVFRESF